MTIVYRAFGPLLVERDGVELRLGRPQARLLFAILLAEANQVVSVDRLAEALWGASPPPSYRVQIQGLVSQLRRALREPGDADPIVTVGHGYRLPVSPGKSDVDSFAEFARRGRQLLADGDLEAGVRVLREGLALWRGAVLEDVRLDALTEFVTAWEERRLAVLEECIDAQLRLGADDELSTELRELITAHPFRERFCGQLMTALADRGRAADALAVYQRWREKLVEELGVEPSAALRGIQVGILRTEPAQDLQQLDPESLRLLTRLAVLPMPEFSAWIAAAVVDGDPAEAERLLGDLRERQLVRESGRRYRLHDLVRTSVPETVGAEREAALERVLGGLLWQTERAAARLPGSVLRPEPGAAKRWPVDIPPPADPLAWFEAEQQGIEDAVGYAAAAGFAELAWEIAATAASYFDYRGLYQEWARCHYLALTAVREAGDARGEAALLRGIGQLHIYWDEFTDAVKALSTSYRISSSLGDRLGMARALTGLGVVSRVTWRPEQAHARSVRALEMFVECGDRLGAAHSHTSIAAVCLELGQLADAESALDQARRLCAELGDDHRMALVLRRVGQLHLRRGDPERALASLYQAIERLESLRDDQCAAQVRLDIGRAHRVLGECQDAARLFKAASSRFTRVGNRSSAAACVLEIDRTGVES
ncbi:AfsR/SARP family transcriptional regulator [Amycolatopsis magusensis]|uniref:DNA-binding SARP family transcriptional activator n=1 Tax=Amycolatopsis magusensis TaxID=882444 RepID=A0ABS4Q5F8_9PSEU|nr:BTAD domain-containing putative transcriptional regulator [Amycolatopsis magusensis]MBP2186916.1 DNA-binding SARP family transcriptional activator [Amycolatopsis magusensis]